METKNINKINRMETIKTIRKHGNSLVVIINRDDINFLKVKENSIVKITIERIKK